MRTHCSGAEEQKGESDCGLFLCLHYLITAKQVQSVLQPSSNESSANIRLTNGEI